MRSRPFSLLPSALVLLSCTTFDVLSSSIAIPRPPPGSKLVVVVGGRGEDAASKSKLPQSRLSDMVPGASQLIGERKRMMILPSASSHEEIKRQGLLNKPPHAEFNKKEKPRLSKLIPPSARHISGINPDIFHQRGNEKRLGGGSQLVNFRPHQPDITADIQSNGKLSLPVMAFTEENGLGLGTPVPTPMANKINPYTNGVASSFPPGIDPYEGFIRYAAENLDTPMGNIVDYHSLEHYYGPQHPLSPHHAAQNTGNLKTNPYADSFGYGGVVETGNSPPPPPPPGFDEPPPDFGEDTGPPSHGPGGGGFRSHNNALGDGRSGSRSNNPNTVRPTGYSGHGIDHFNAPSPGLDAAPPIRRPTNTDAALYDDHHGHRTPPFEQHNRPSQFHSNRHQEAPFKQQNSHLSSNHGFDEEDRPPLRTHSHHSPEPPDLDVFEEGPPPPGAHPPIPRPPHGSDGPSHGGDGPHHGGEGFPNGSEGPPHGVEGHPHGGEGPPQRGEGPNHHPQNHAAENNDGGEDSIWGILDIAEMIEKGQLPGSGTGKDGKAQSSPQVANKNRLVVPIFTRPPPPRSYGENNTPHDDEPPIIPDPHSPQSSQEASSSGKGGFPSVGEEHQGSDGGFDYDEHPVGGNNNNRHQSSFGSPLESHESNDYGEDYNG